MIPWTTTRAYSRAITDMRVSRVESSDMEMRAPVGDRSQ